MIPLQSADLVVPAGLDGVGIGMARPRSCNSMLKEGMPWQTTWLMEVQIERGNPR